MAGFWQAEPSGVAVRVKVQPRARRPGPQGIGPSADGPRLKLGVTEPPEDGRANRAVCATLAKLLGVAGSAATVRLGAGAREKTIAVTGDPAMLAARLEALA